MTKLINKKINIENTNIDNAKGPNGAREWTKKEFDELDDFRRLRFEKLSNEKKLHNTLLSFRYTLEEYLNKEEPNEIISLGEFIKSILIKIKVKQNRFANYIDLTPQNFNKYLVGQRKINIDLAMKFEKIFNVKADILINIQLKNEILLLKRTHIVNYNKYKLNDLLSL